jgi:hypothetical protein
MLKEALTADNGNVSYARVSGFILILAFIVWDTYQVFSDKGITDIPVGLAAMIVALYGINKFKTEQTGESNNPSTSA